MAVLAAPAVFGLLLGLLVVSVWLLLLLLARSCVEAFRRQLLEEEEEFSEPW